VCELYRHAKGGFSLMTAQSVQHTIRICAPANAVWDTIVDAKKIAGWMGGTEIETTWQLGSAISFAGELHGHPYRDRGTVLAREPYRLLRYNHWSALSRREDSEQARTVVTFTLTSEGDETTLDVHHDNLRGKAAWGHARFFWRNALNDIKNIAEAAHHAPR
jgi:uncharacterized protein YndB with AHSA1/START domain